MSAALSWGIESYERADRSVRPRSGKTVSEVTRKVATLLVRRERQAEWVLPPARTRATTPVEDLVGRLRGLERYEAGWDGREAAAANPASFDDARSFAYLLNPRDFLPDEGIHANGNAVLVFERPGLFASVQFYGNGEVSAYVRQGTEEWDDDLVFDGRTLPSPLPEKIGLTGTR